MKIHFAQPLPGTPERLLRAARYAPHFDKKMGKLSYTRKMGGDFYPRFHVYVTETDKVVTFDLHLDQKKASYAGSNMHSGEYDGPVVEKEIMRMKQEFQRFVRERLD
ncbi:TPA: hypothetical protein DEB00_01945 [Candidatus Uhrbacteria bacterium]|nr:hypothetical protein [Candidatus Uhrbacteria bacterium]